jgi:hypothetical protein
MGWRAGQRSNCACAVVRAVEWGGDMIEVARSSGARHPRLTPHIIWCRIMGAKPLLACAASEPLAIGSWEVTLGRGQRRRRGRRDKRLTRGGEEPTREDGGPSLFDMCVV